ncbi:MAG: tRNA 2-selenouridine(34) synthase MnmH [Neisseriales bacterium]|nr:MAG: tRNA 2-selenouridine(34) synthase MnmH [Neisseriales bacterium]
MRTSRFVRSANIAQLNEFTEIIDVRTPSEFAADHIPGARNCPILSDEERSIIGELHQTQPFAARKLGGVYIARRISQWIEQDFIHADRHWKPLLYCWRGGMRSRALAIVLNQIGWQACQLIQGYKAYRKHVLTTLNRLPEQLSLHVVCGSTGTGKSQLLHALAQYGAQIIDLEMLAQHKGSVLGLCCDKIQPTQRMFDSMLWQTLRCLDPNRPIFIEAESRHIGNIGLPDALYQRMHQSHCILLEAPIDQRVLFLLKEYQCFVNQPDQLIQQLTCLIPVKGRVIIEEWQKLVRQGHFAHLVQKLLQQHYDPLYWRALHKNYHYIGQARLITLPDLEQATIQQSALTLIHALT